MSGKYPRLILLLGLVVIAGGLVTWRLLPKVINELPAEIRGRIPEEFLSQVMTPIPTALPPPLTSSNPEDQEEGPPVSPTDVLPQRLVPTYTPQPTSLSAAAIIEQPKQADSSAAATSTPTRIPVPPIAEVTGLEVIAQKFNNCGPANLAMVLNYYGADFDQLEVAAVLRPNADDRNVSPDELAEFVSNNSDLRARVHVGGDRFLLKRLISQGYPVIVEKGLIPSEWQGWMGHYLTLYGYDDRDRTFLAMDTYLGPWDDSGRREEYSSLEELWEHFNFVFIVIYPESDEDLIAAILGEDVSQEAATWHRAALKAQQSLNDDPENAFAWFNLGSSLTKIAELSHSPTLFSGAALAFDEARKIGLPWRMLWYQFELYRAYLGAGRSDEVLALTDVVLASDAGRDVEETYFYRAIALEAAGRTQEAQRAQDKAKRLNPNNALFQNEVFVPVPGSGS